MPFESGQRDRLVTIQTLTASVGSSNFPVETWTDLRQEWASKNDVRARERFVNGQNAPSADTRFDLAWSAEMDPELVDVTTKRRIVYQGRAFDIVAAEHLGRRDGICLTTLSRGEASSS